MLPVRLVLSRLLLVLVAVLAVVPGTARADALPAPALTAPSDGISVTGNPTFRWEGVDRATKYQVEVTPTTGSPKTIDTYGTSAVLVAELPLGTATWKVRTYNANAPAGFGPWSEPRTFERVQAAAPAATAPANGAQIDLPAAPVLRWDALPGVHHYVIEVDDESGFNIANRKTYETSNTALALPAALPADSLRYWHVRGESANGQVTTQWSSTRSFEVAWPVDTKPTLLGPDDTLATDIDDPTFTWSEVAGAAKYEIQISTDDDFPNDATATTTQRTGMTSYRPKSMPAGDEYFWRVRALGRDGTAANFNATSWSDTSSFKRAWLDGAAPARPAVTMTDTDGSLLNGHQVERDRLRISWTPVPHATYYEVEVSVSPAFEHEPSDSKFQQRICNTPNTEWTPYLVGEYTDSDAGDFGPCAWTATGTSKPSTFFITEDGGPYYVRVRAVDVRPSGVKLYSAYSNQATTVGGTVPPEVSFTLVDSLRPETPGTLPAFPIDSPDSEGTPTLTWEPVENAVAYRLMLAKDETFTNRVLDTHVVTTQTEFTLNQVLDDNVAGQPYHWFAVPCTRWDDVGDPDNSCPVGDNQAIGNADHFETFEKQSRAVSGLESPDAVDTISLSWDNHFQPGHEGNGVKWYDVEVYNSQGTKVEDVQTDATGYTPVDKGYAVGTYTWKVTAIDAAGQPMSVADGPGFAKTSAAPVTDATPASGETLPTLDWEPTGFAGSYNVVLYTGTGFTTPYEGDVSDWAEDLQYSSATPDAALPAGTYTWRVQAVDFYGNPGPLSSDVRTFTIGGTQPTLSDPVDEEMPVPSLEFAWSEVPGAVTYKLETSTTEGFNSAHQTVTTTETSYAPSVAYTGGTTYHWRVTPINAAGHPLSASAVESFVAQTAPVQPAKPTMTVDGATIDVTWVAPGDGGADIEGYVVRWRVSNSGDDWTEIVVDDPATLEATLTGLAPSTTYEAQVAAVNAIGTGLFSLSQTKASASLPGTVKNLAVATGSQSLTVTWSPPSVSVGGLPVTGYTVRWTPSAGGPSDEKSVETPNTTITGLEDETEYVVEVLAVNAMGTGDPVAKNGSTAGLPPVPDTVINSGPANNATVNTASPSFGFAANPAGEAASFECSVDGAAFAACTSPAALSGLGDGEHTFSVRVVDSRDRRDQTPATRTFAVDTVAPDTQIDGGPTGTSTVNTATFTYSSPGAARLECRLDGAAFATCPSSGKTYTGVANGEHTFAVRAVDGAGNADATPAERTWTVDAPEATPTPSPSPSPAPSASPSPSPEPTASPSPSPTASPEPTASPQCKVPRLKGKTRKAARRALAKAKCGVGAIKGPRTGRVKSQTVEAGKTGASGMKVGFKLAKAKRRR